MVLGGGGGETVPGVRHHDGDRNNWCFLSSIPYRHEKLLSAGIL